MLSNVQSDVVLDPSSALHSGLAGTLAVLNTVLDPVQKFSETSNVITQPYFVKKFVVLVQPIILFGLAVFFPIFMLLSGFSFKGVFLYSTITFAIKFIPYLLTLSTYISSQVSSSDWSNFGALGAIDGGVFLIVMAWFPIILGLILTLVLSWAGATAGKQIDTALAGGGPGSIGVSGIGSASGSFTGPGAKGISRLLKR